MPEVLDAPQVHVYDDSDIEAVMKLDGVIVEDWIVHMGFSCDYLGSGVWLVDGVHHDGNGVREFLKRQKGYQA